jgi:Reverse transcriptase (RNA-dependent DNA polymerase)
LNALAWRDELLLYPGDLGPLIEGILTYGARIRVTALLPARICSNQLPSDADPGVITTKIASDLPIGRIAICPPEAICCSPLGLVPKPDGTFRRIHNLSSPKPRRGLSVNAAIPEAYSTLTYSTVDDILALILLAGRGAVILKRDLKDAFRNIPVAITDQRLLGFKWEKTVYTECCLPFGLSTAPFLFNLFAEALHWVLERRLHPIIAFFALVHYLDDFIFILRPGTSYTPVVHVYNFTITLLGFPPNATKDSCGTVSDVLGYQINTNTFFVSLSPAKQMVLQDLLASFVLRPQVSLKQCQQLGGSLAWAAKVIYLGRSYSRSLWDLVTAFSLINRRALPIPPAVISDLAWWSEALALRNGVRFFQEDTTRPQIYLFTDASSKYGYAGFFYSCPGHTSAETHSTPCSQWRPHASTLLQDNLFAVSPASKHLHAHINVLEVLAITDAFVKWSPAWQHSSVHVYTDNTVALAGLQNTVLKGPANLLLRQILVQAAAFDIQLQSSWISSEDNTLADALSRFDWATVKNLCPQIDLSVLTAYL